MNENETSVFSEVVKNLATLSEEHVNRILGITEGLIIAGEKNERSNVKRRESN